MLAFTLLFLALGLSLAFVPRGTWLSSLFALFASIAGFASLTVPLKWLEGAYLAFWISVVATAACVHLAGALRHRSVAVVLSLNAGAWASVAAGLSQSRLDVLLALPCVLILFPAAWVTARYTSVPVKVVSSWIIAVAALAAALQLLSVTPGYLPDHLE